MSQVNLSGYTLSSDLDLGALVAQPTANAGSGDAGSEVALG